MDKWAAEEFGGAELGDGRLTNRLIKIASDFADKP
ncbi:transposase DNA-binding-containing protein, partial [Accumulibacter sp.]